MNQEKWTDMINQFKSMNSIKEVTETKSIVTSYLIIQTMIS